MAVQGATQTIIDWIFSTGFDDMPAGIRRQAVLSLYDGVGANLACSLLPVAHRTVDFIKLVGGPPDCTVIGFPDRSSVLNAAQVNGTLGHADEVDAIESDGLGAHVLAANLGACLSAGQYAGASGREVLRGLVLGFELTKRVHRVAAVAQDRSVLTAGSSATLIDAGNTMGATAAAGVPLGLSPGQMDIAFGMAAAMTSGITPFARESEHMLKSFVRGGLGARNGVAAALMAKAGYDGPRGIFEGSNGFFHSRLGIEDPGPEFVEDRYTIQDVVFKRVSAGGPNQAPRQGVVEIMAENGLTAADISRITIEVPPIGFTTITEVHHPSIEGKDVIAIGAVYGGTGFLAAHNPKYGQSDEVLAMRNRIEILPREEWAGEGRFRSMVTIETSGGRHFSRESTYRPMSEDDLDAKFADLVGMRAGEDRSRELAEALKGLEVAPNVSDVMPLLELPGARIEDY